MHEIADKLRELANEIDKVDKEERRYSDIKNAFSKHAIKTVKIMPSLLQKGGKIEVWFHQNEYKFGTDLTGELNRCGYYMAGWYGNYCIVGKI